MKKYSLVICFLITGLSLKAQKFTLFENAQKWDKNRYSDIKGSPFFFKDFVEGDIYEKGGKIFKKMSLNLNGYTQNIEVRKGEVFIELNESSYSKVEVSRGNKNEEVSKTVFVISYIGKFAGRFVQLVYDGKNRQLYNDFLVTVNENKTETPGKTEIIKRFAPKNRYFLLEDSELTIFKPKKKFVIQQFGHKKEIDIFLKKNKIKIESVEGIVKLLEYVESLD